MSLETKFVQQEQPYVDGFLDFVNASPSPYHAVANCKATLIAAGYTELSETKQEQWDAIAPGGKYFTCRNQSSIIAFAVGGKYKPGNGFSIVGAHTDSPCPKIKPVSARTSMGYLQCGVELYGGGLWNTWFDRDLSVAGRVIVNEGDKYTSKLVRINRPILRIPNLAIHLNRTIYEKGFKPNMETHVVPVLATSLKAALAEQVNATDTSASSSGSSKKRKTTDSSTSSASSGPQSSNTHPLLLQIVANELQVPVSDIRDFELFVYDTQPSATGGALNEFIFSPRLDNLMMTFCGLKALVDSDSTLASDPNVRVFMSFDNEEVGSNSNRGAGSRMALSVLQRITGGKVFETAMAKSFLISADMAHAIHPNYSDKHESQHRPAMHKGLVIKHNAKQRYATNAATAFVIRHIAEKHNIPVQDFVVRQDMGCGSTIGPILATNCGVRTVDVGAPQLSMHSVREMSGTEDVLHSIRLFQHFFQEFAAVDASLKVD